MPYPLSAPRFVALKGIAEPVEVVTVDWREARQDRTAPADGAAPPHA